MNVQSEIRANASVTIYEQSSLSSWTLPSLVFVITLSRCHDHCNQLRTDVRFLHPPTVVKRNVTIFLNRPAILLDHQCLNKIVWNSDIAMTWPILSKSMRKLVNTSIFAPCITGIKTFRLIYWLFPRKLLKCETSQSSPSKNCCLRVVPCGKGPGRALLWPTSTEAASASLKLMSKYQLTWTRPRSHTYTYKLSGPKKEEKELFVGETTAWGVYHLQNADASESTSEFS